MAYPEVMATDRPPRGMTPNTAELYDRVVRLFATRSVSFADRQAIREALGPALKYDSGVDLKFADLPTEVRQLIETNEAKPQIDGWRNPKDVPPRDMPPAAPDPDGRYLTIEQAAPPPTS